MKKLYICFILFLTPFLSYSMGGAGELQLFGSQSNREHEVDGLMQQFFASDSLPEQHRVLLKKRLLALSQDEYLAMVAQIRARGAAFQEGESEKDELVKALFAIVTQLDRHNENMEKQVGQLERFNDAQDEDGEREEEAHELAKQDSMFAKYSWKVSTVLGVLGTLLGTGIAIWQGDEAAKC